MTVVFLSNCGRRARRRCHPSWWLGLLWTTQNGGGVCGTRGAQAPSCLCQTKEENEDSHGHEFDPSRAARLSSQITCAPQNVVVLVLRHVIHIDRPGLQQLEYTDAFTSSSARSFLPIALGHTPSRGSEPRAAYQAAQTWLGDV